VPVLAFRVTEPGVQKLTGPAAMMEAVGNTSTVTVVLAVPEHPLLLVPVTVYVVVETGLAVTEEPVVELRPAVGDHE
jgi:hypothetical protein